MGIVEHGENIKNDWAYPVRIRKDCSYRGLNGKSKLLVFDRTQTSTLLFFTWMFAPDVNCQVWNTNKPTWAPVWAAPVSITLLTSALDPSNALVAEWDLVCRNQNSGFHILVAMESVCQCRTANYNRLLSSSQSVKTKTVTHIHTTVLSC